MKRLGLMCAAAFLGVAICGGRIQADDGNFVAKNGGLGVGTAGTYDSGAAGESSEAVTVSSSTQGIRGFAARHGLLQWDASGGVRTGYAQGYAGPFIGVQTDLGLEVGARPYEVKGCWSPYVGVGGEFAVSPVWILSKSPLSNFLANSNKVGGSAVTGTARLTAGASCLDAGHSLMVYGFVQDALRAPAGLAYPLLPDFYSEKGAGVRYDTKRLSVIGEALYGTTQSSDPNAESGTELNLSARVRVKLPHKWTAEVITDVSRYQVKPAQLDPYPATIGATGKVNFITPL